MECHQISTFLFPILEKWKRSFKEFLFCLSLYGTTPSQSSIYIYYFLEPTSLLLFFHLWLYWCYFFFLYMKHKKQCLSCLVLTLCREIAKYVEINRFVVWLGLWDVDVIRQKRKDSGEDIKKFNYYIVMYSI